MRDFDEWFKNFKSSIASYDYYVNFDKVYRNTESIKVELNILNSLIGSQDIEADFERIIIKYPETLKCIPILLAVRANEIQATDNGNEYIFKFDKPNYSIEQYKIFMQKTGLFELLSNHLIGNLIDYVTGVETGLDSNARKSRGGDLMEDLVEKYIEDAGFVKGVDYFKEMNLSSIEQKWNINLSAISNEGKTEKRFDFVIKTNNMVYGIETNFYASNGSKLNETARSYKTLAIESKDIAGFKFVWITDGHGWKAARHNLEETFDVLDCMYSIKDLENGLIRGLNKC